MLCVMLLCSQGEVGYFGPPANAVDYFQALQKQIKHERNASIQCNDFTDLLNVAQHKDEQVLKDIGRKLIVLSNQQRKTSQQLLCPFAPQIFFAS